MTIRELAETRIDAVRLVSHRTTDGLTTARFDVGGMASYDVEVRTTRAGAEQLTCKALRANPVPQHVLVGVQRV